MAGATVLSFQDFSSCQGDWFAFVENQGKRYLVGGVYGSCSGCDAFQSESNYKDRTIAEWESFCKTFGERYLNYPLDLGIELKKFREQAKWDGDALEVITFLEEGAKSLL